MKEFLGDVFGLIGILTIVGGPVAVYFWLPEKVAPAILVVLLGMVLLMLGRLRACLGRIERLLEKPPEQN